ncbi:FUSC family protein [Xanthomarina sp. F1114]|uniref:FUSC family protein n=1 Tax=Xanthomarina sp. F1114 TaxID=2996019 RepID=UPI00225E4079|nr:FUSC family membrane protein [Xanthomarina sp. F1114]MCX7547806.1 FUSC family protein [Xanthomarina sp. F1114]
MGQVNQIISKNYKELLQFFKSNDFSKAVIIGFAITTPIVLGLLFDHLDIGLAICFGAFWCSPSDVSGNPRHKINGILFSALLIAIVSFIGGYLQYRIWLTIPVLGILTFAIAFISVYGFRASLISFSGLLALVLSFAHTSDTLEIYEYAILIGVGGLWYLCVTMLWHYINPKAQTEEKLATTFTLTAEFLETRGQLIDPKNNRESLQTKLQDLQSDLVENHATLREILIHTRKNSGRSTYKGKRLLIFARLVEMLETAVANPVNYKKMDALLEKHPDYILSFQKLIFEMANQLRAIAEVGASRKKLPNNKYLTECFEQVKDQINVLKTETETSDYEVFLMLQNLLEYQEKQFLKLKRIKWLLGNPDLDSIEFIDSSESKRFLVSQDYDPKLLLRNLSFKSNIFRHCLRLSVTVMIGYTIGTVFSFQNPYWILLTIIVIMRPSYGLTKTRSKDRIIGTLIGGAIAMGMVFLIQNPYVYGALGILSLVIAFSMVQRNYKASATFITLSVVFIYAILQPDVLAVIQFRIIDTVLGAGLSYMAMLWLWPAWSFSEISENIETSVAANKDFLNEISSFYQLKGQVPTSYKVSRKIAFLETSNLNSAFQRMAQEPKSKQKNLDKIYELVEINHTFLSSLSSLSSYIQYHPTTEASEMFIKATNKIDQNLVMVLKTLKEGPDKTLITIPDEDAFFNEQLTNNMRYIASETASSERNFQEAHLVWEQLRWLYAMSRSMLKITNTIHFN